VKSFYFLIATFYFTTFCDLHSQEQELIDATKFLKNNVLFDEKLKNKRINTEKLLVVYDSTITNIKTILVKPEKQILNSFEQIEFVSINDAKRTFGDKVCDNNSNICDLLNKKNAGLLFLINKNLKGLLEGYLYEGANGNCLLHKHLILNDQDKTMEYLLSEFDEIIRFYKNKFENNNSPIYIKTSAKISELLKVSRVSRYKAYICFLLCMNPNVALLISEDNAGEFTYCTKSKIHNMIYFEATEDAKKFVRFCYIKDNKIKIMEIENNDSLKNVYDDISNKLMTAYSLRIENVKYSEVHTFINSYLNIDSVYLTKEFLGYCLFPFNENSSFGFYNRLNRNNFKKNYFSDNEKEAIVDKFNIELCKLDILKEEFDKLKTAEERPHVDFKFDFVFNTEIYSIEQKKLIFSIRNDLLIKNIGILVGKSGDRFEGFENFDLKSTDELTLIFTSFYNYYDKSLFGLDKKIELIKKYFHAIENFRPWQITNEYLNNNESKNEIAKNLQIIYSYNKSEDDLLKFKSLSQKIKNFEYENSNSNKETTEAEVIGAESNEFKKDFKEYLPLLFKYLNVAEEEDLLFFPKLPKAELRYSIADELMESIRKKWTSQEPSNYEKIYFSIFCAKFSLGYRSTNKNINEQKIIEKALSEQFVVLSKYFDSFKDDNIITSRHLIFSQFLYCINRIASDSKSKNNLFADYYNTILVPGMKAKLLKPEYIDLLNSFIRVLSDQSDDDEGINICNEVFNYMDELKVFVNRDRDKIFLQNCIEKMKIKNSQKSIPLVAPDFLIAKLILNKNKIDAEFKYSFDHNSKTRLMLEGYVINNNEVGKLFSRFTSESKNLKLYLLKNSLFTGMSSFSKEFDGDILIDKDEKNLKSKEYFSRLNLNQVAIFKDCFYIVHKEKLIQFDHETGKGAVANFDGFDNNNVLMIKGIDNNLFIFSGDIGNFKKVENKFGVYDVEKKIFKCVLANDELGGNGLINTSDFKVFSVYKYKEKYYVSLDSMDTGSGYSNKKICSLDLANGDHQKVCGLNDEKASLFFNNNKIYYFNHNSYFCKDLNNKKDFIESTTNWVGQYTDSVPVKNGVLYVNSLKNERLLFYFDFETKLSQVNPNIHLNGARILISFYTDKGLILIDSNENILLFPNLKDGP